MKNSTKNNKEAFVILRTTKKDKEMIRQYCRENKVNISDMVRVLIKDHLMRISA